ncbi:DNA translocase FtsK 4TM domain-containing protein [Staphylococcus epidermidis]|nr:DNA translocase FtsK 4TM domain-containing protein [Staphylococcus epidermidis]
MPNLVLPPALWGDSFQPGGLLIGLLALVFWLMAMFTYCHKIAWSTSGPGKAVCAQLDGACGAWPADACYALLVTPSGGWCWLPCRPDYRWCAGCAAGEQGRNKPTGPDAAWRRRFLFWGGLAVLMIASCTGVDAAVSLRACCPVRRAACLAT